jgi:hypothetical protein
MAQKGDLCSAGAQALLLVDTLRTLGQLQVHGRVDRGIAGAKNGARSFLSAVSLCLSRACLGKMIVFSLYVNGSKMPFFAGRL